MAKVLFNPSYEICSFSFILVLLNKIWPKLHRNKICTRKQLIGSWKMYIITLKSNKSSTNHQQMTSNLIGLNYFKNRWNSWKTFSTHKKSKRSELFQLTSSLPLGTLLLFPELSCLGCHLMCVSLCLQLEWKGKVWWEACRRRRNITATESMLRRTDIKSAKRTGWWQVWKAINPEMNDKHGGQREIFIVCVLPLRRSATLGSLCTGLMSSSASVCLPHSGLAWLICWFNKSI